jgi:DNA-binding NarL/FixJ family response regulator
MKPRLLLADDHALVLEGLCTLLERDFEIVGTATEGRELLALAKQTRPDAILVDISMPNLNGIEAMRQIRSEMPEARIIVLTQYTDPHYVQAAFRAGASGYVVKQSAGSELRTAVHQVLAGRFYLAPAIAQKASGEIDPMTNPAELFGAALTTRQREVLHRPRKSP